MVRRQIARLNQHFFSMSEQFPRSHHSLPHGRNGVSPPVNGTAVEEDEITLQEIVDVLLKWKGTILGTFGAVLILAAAYTFLQAPTYEASSLLYVNKGQSAPQLGQLLGLQGAASEVANEVEILQSRTIALGVARNLMDRRYLPGTDTLLSILEHEENAEEPFTRFDVMSRLRNGYVEIQPVGPEVDLINIFSYSVYPEEAALIADLYAQEYVAYNRAMSRERIAASREYLDDMVETFRTRLQYAEDTLRTFMNRTGIVAPNLEAEYLMEQILELRQRKYGAQLSSTAARTQLRDLRAQLEAIRPEVAEELASSNDAVLRRLKNEIGRLTAQIESKYAKNPGLRAHPERAPELIEKKEQIEELKAEVQERARQLVEQPGRTAGIGVELPAGVGGELPVTGSQVTLGRLRGLQSAILNKEIALRTNQARLEVINEKLNELNAQLQQIPDKEIILGRLERSLNMQESVYLSLVKQLQQARVAMQAELGYVDVVDEALVPRAPVSPRVSLNLALGAVLGLMLGVGLAFLRNAFDDKVHTPEELGKRGYSVIGVLPDMQRVIDDDFDGRERVEVGGHTYDTSLITLLNPLSPVAEAYRRVRTNIQFSRPDGKVQTVLVTSSGPGEGKSTTSLNLAVAMAQTGRRTVYVDADLRRATGHDRMGVSREPGLVDVLFEPHFGNIERFATDVDDLYVVPAGSQVPNPAEIIGSGKMREFVDHLEASFDAIVIDSPPILAVTDAQLLARHADANVLVCSSGQTGWDVLDHSATSLRDVGAGVAGVVLNRYNANASSGYGYGYGYGYGTEEYLSNPKAVKT